MADSGTNRILELQEKASLFRVLKAMVIILISNLALGTSFGFTATAAVAFTNPNTTTLEYILNEEEISWLMSIIVLSVMISMPIGGTLAEIFGRKRTLIIGQLCILIGWAVVYIARQFLILLLGRFLVGFGIGTSLPVTMLHLSEISLIRMRGTLSMMGYLVMNMGCIYSFTMASQLSLKALIIATTIPSILFLVFSIFLPESPVWLMKKGQIENSQKTLLALRGPRYEMNPEIKELQDLVVSQDNTTLIEKIQELKSRSNAIPFLVMTTIMMLQPLCGAETIVNYALVIFERAEVEMKHYLLLILVQSATLSGYTIAAFLTPRVKRKIHFIMGVVMMGISQAICGLALKAEDFQNEWFINISKIVLPLSVMMTTFGYGIGCGPVPNSLLGEIIPLKIKSMATAIIISLKFIVIFINVKIFPTCANWMGLSGVFWIHSSICILVCIVATKILPETQGKSLTELSQLYSDKTLPTTIQNKKIIEEKGKQ